MWTNVSSVLKVSDIIDTNGISPTEIPKRIWETVFYFQNYVDEILKNLWTDLRIDWWANDNQLYTVVDVRNLRWLNNNQIKSLFSNNFAIDIESNEWIEKVNDFYQSAIDFIEKRYWKKVPSEVRNRKILDVSDIKTILDSTWQWVSWIFYCAISKVMFSIIPAQNDVRISGIGKIHQEISEYIANPLHSTEEIAEWVEEWKITIDETWFAVPVVLYHRKKELESIYWKEMWNSEYKSMDDFKDLHWFTLEMDSKNPLDMILILQRYYFILRDRAKIKKDDDWLEIDIENKNMISLEDLEKYKDNIDPDFYEILYEAIRKSQSKSAKKQEEKWTNKEYKDIKITTKFRSSNPKWRYLSDVYSWTEFKFTQKWNNNEKWLSFHPIFDYKKRLRELTRVFGFVTKFDLVFFVNEFFDKLDENLMKKWKKRWTYLRELVEDLKSPPWNLLWRDFNYIANSENNLLEIKKALFRHFEAELVKVKMTENSRTYFYAHKSYFKLAPDLQPQLTKI